MVGSIKMYRFVYIRYGIRLTVSIFFRDEPGCTAKRYGADLSTSSEAHGRLLVVPCCSPLCSGVPLLGHAPSKVASCGLRSAPPGRPLRILIGPVQSTWLPFQHSHWPPPTYGTFLMGMCAYVIFFFSLQQQGKRGSAAVAHRRRRLYKTEGIEWALTFALSPPRPQNPSL